MSYIGQRPVVGRYIKLDQISSGFNGSNTSFSMTSGSQAVFPGTARNLLLSLGGVIQEPDTSFTISGSTLTFTTAPVANTTFFAVIFGDMQSTGTPSDGTVLPASIASSGNFSFPQLTVTGTSSLGDDVTFTGANYNVVWDKSDNALEFADSAKAVFGDGADLQIYHDGSQSYIVNATSDLRIRSGYVKLQGANSENMLVGNQNTSVELYYDNNKKFETTSAGISVTGSITSTDSANVADGHVLCQLDSGNGRLKLLNGSDAITVDIQGSVGNVKIVDNGKFQAGDSNDLQIYHDGSHSNIINSTGILKVRGVAGQSITFRNGDDSANVAVFNVDDATHLYFDSAHKFSTNSTGIRVIGNCIPGSNDSGQLGTSSIRWQELNITDVIDVSDDGKIRMGDSDDLQIFHDGTHSRIKNSTGDLFINSDTIIRLQSFTGPETMAKFFQNGQVELYYDNSKKLETVSTGVYVYGNLGWGIGGTGNLFGGDNSKLLLGSGNDLQLYHDGSNSYIKDSGTGGLLINSSGFDVLNADDNEFMARFIQNGAVELYYDSVKRLETLSDGAQCKGVMHVLSQDGNVVQHTEALYKFIGTSSSATVTLTGLIGSGRFVIGGYANAGQGAIALNIFFGGAMFATQHYDVNVLQNNAMQNTAISLSKNGTSYVITITNNSTSYGLGLSGFLESTGAQMSFAWS